MATGVRQASDWLPDEFGQPEGSGDAGSGDRGGAEPADVALRRLEEHAERAKLALTGVQTSTEGAEQRAQGLGGDWVLDRAETVEAKARTAASAAERLADKVAELSERLAAQEQELKHLRSQAAGP